MTEYIGQQVSRDKQVKSHREKKVNLHITTQKHRIGIQGRRGIQGVRGISGFAGPMGFCTCSECKIVCNEISKQFGNWMEPPLTCQVYDDYVPEVKLLEALEEPPEGPCGRQGERGCLGAIGRPGVCMCKNCRKENMTLHDWKQQLKPYLPGNPYVSVQMLPHRPPIAKQICDLISRLGIKEYTCEVGRQGREGIPGPIGFTGKRGPSCSCPLEKT